MTALSESPSSLDKNCGPLDFRGITPVAPEGLGGLPRDHFSNGRLFVSVGAHGGIVNLGYWGNQHLGAGRFFQGDAGTGWVKLFRVSLKISGKRHYPILKRTELLPFGLRSRGEADGVAFSYDLLLLSDALVQRVRILENPENRPVGLEVLHQESVTAVIRPNRIWGDFEFSQERNALIASCRDENPAAEITDESLAQRGLRLSDWDPPLATTWIGLGSPLPLSARCGYHARSKHYLETSELPVRELACYLVFSTDREGLCARLSELSASVHRECDGLIGGYEARLASRPKIRTGNPILDSAFGQFPELIQHMKVPDRPGAVRATVFGYFVWGWDGMMPFVSCPLANEAAYSAEILRFFHQTRQESLGLPHQFTTSFKARLKAPFPAQHQFVAGLYLYTAATGDLEVAREVWPTCEAILAHCREDEVRGTGLVSGNALWPDFPEAMEEDGNDISSMNNSLLYQGLRCLEYFAAALGKMALAEECRAWAARLRVSFRKYFFDEEKGFFISSCSSNDLKPRRHYCPQSIFWLTPFARELVSHSPRRIVEFMNGQLRSAKCLRTLPHWDTAWMADGNQLGSSYPAADAFYLGVHKLMSDDSGLKAWLGDVEWFWRHHTAPEAFTPEAENEADLGPDNIGAKQLQAVTTWYAGAYQALAGLDVDHEGITLSPHGSHPFEVLGLKLRNANIDLRISGSGKHIGSLTLNGVSLSGASHKINWVDLGIGTAQLELTRSETAPVHPVIVRADGLRIAVREAGPGRLIARVSGEMSGEIAIRTPSTSQVFFNGKLVKGAFESDAGTLIVPIESPGEVTMEVLASAHS